MATAQEVLMWALVNRARLNPTGEGIDINEGPVTNFNGQAVTMTANSKQPLAWNDALGAAADLHSRNMLDRDFFAHTDPSTGKDDEGRARDAGYAGRTAENISWQGYIGTVPLAEAVKTQHQSLFWDLKIAGRGHRYNILDDQYQEIGIGQQTGDFTFTDSSTGQLRTLPASMITQDFGIPTAGGQFLTGIAYNDTDANKFYSATDTAHEGRGGVVVSTTAGAVTTAVVGNYSKAINAGVQTISFSGGGLPQTVSAEVTVAAGRNALVNLVDTSTLETSVSLKALSGVIKIVGLGNIALTLTGNASDNTIVSALGGDTINGDQGTDTVVYSGARGSYVINSNVATGITTVTGFGATDTLTAIERLQFSDQVVTIGTVPPPPPVNQAPTVSITDKSLTVGQTAKISPWVAYSDPENNAAVRFEIIDNGTAANSAALLGPNGAAVADGSTLAVTAADLANVSIRAGTAAGTETMQIRAFDGTNWSAWDSFNFTTNPAPVVNNTAPVTAIDDKSLKVNQWAKVVDWLRYSDAEGNPAVKYEFIDKFTATGSAYLWTTAGQQQAGNVVLTVNAADIGDVWVRGAQTGGFDSMQVRAFDGTSWSAWDNFKVTTLPNAAPVATINDRTVKSNEWVKITDMLTFSDSDGDAAAKFEFTDLFDGAGSAYLWNNGQQPANTSIVVNAADLGNVWVRGGTGSGWENMQVRAYDGMSWGAWDKFKITTVANAAPVATINDKSVSKNEWVKVSTLLTATDANGDAITQYEFMDLFGATGSAYFFHNGQKAANQAFTVGAADLANVWIRGAEAAGWENMQVRAFDGTSWGAWDSFKFTTLNNIAPTVTGNEDISLRIGQKVAAKSLFSVIDGDAGDVMTQYQIYDDNADASSGRFMQGSKALNADTTYTVTASSLSKLTYAAGSAAGTDLLWVRAFDGDIWSDWHNFNAHTIV